MNRLRQLLLLSAGVVLCVNSVLGATISDSATLSLTGTNFDYPANYVLTIDKFDTSLGTLTAIDLVFHITDLYTLTLKGGAPGGASFAGDPGFQLGVLGSVRGPNNGSLTASLASYFASGSYSGEDIVLANGQSSDPFTNSPGATQTFNKSITSNSFAAWSGASGDTISLGVKGVNTFSGQASGTYTIEGAAQVGADVAVTYTYTPATPPPAVPEPATMGLMGSALAGVAVLRKKLKK